MKKILALFAIILTCVVFSATNAAAVSFDFGGNYTLTDSNASGFADKLDFNKAFGDVSRLTGADPGADSVLDVGSYVKMSVFSLKEPFTTGGPYEFDPSKYVDGFEVYSSTNTLLFRADIDLGPLSVSGSTGKINSGFLMNLTNIEVLVAGSPVLDGFAPPVPGASVNFTINFAGVDLAKAIENGGAAGSYSASAAPVPEPATMLLLGCGLLGLAGISRKKFKMQ